MTLLTKLHLVLTGSFAALLVFFAIYAVSKQRSYEKKIVELQNVAASKDQTIELKDGLYHKLTLQNDNLQKLLSSKDKTTKDLLEQIRKGKQDILAVNEINVGLKHQLEELKNATQTTVPGQPGKPDRTKVDFHDDFGVVRVDGWTITNPAQSWVRLSPGKPLRLTLAVSQDKDKAWHTYVTTDDDRFGVDIHLAAVNPYLFKPHWYEGIGITTGLGVGSNQSGLGALVSVGLNYKLRQFSFGPAVWFGINGTVDKYYGLTFEWRPFEKTH